ncbi:hypothetical protein CORC01_03035 [Colletotrichum orchidophilum]|uniref:Uncharacterized protein n=1 Tax=Colletotrichum orchidophilum TaxID=1209926 RepID=A0A1G4BJM8_9PEZI|nr:uncharacterized protein CORC01_03035 [Colletotrichum orchidophilum]OHF01545.1 hypothetical protein CORC01_03035 [Colletotrichum orchidophilum]
MGYRNNINLIGLPLITIYPDDCPDVANNGKAHVSLSSSTSRKAMGYAGRRIYCSLCSNSGRPQHVMLSDGSIPRAYACAKDHPVEEAEFRVEWTCCAMGECSDDNLCVYRAAAILHDMPTRTQEAENVIADGQETDTDYDADISGNSALSVVIDYGMACS